MAGTAVAREVYEDVCLQGRTRCDLVLIDSPNPTDSGLCGRKKMMQRSSRTMLGTGARGNLRCHNDHAGDRHWIGDTVDSRADTLLLPAATIGPLPRQSPHRGVRAQTNNGLAAVLTRGRRAAILLWHS